MLLQSMDLPELGHIRPASRFFGFHSLLISHLRRLVGSGLLNGAYGTFALGLAALFTEPSSPVDAGRLTGTYAHWQSARRPWAPITQL